MKTNGVDDKEWQRIVAMAYVVLLSALLILGAVVGIGAWMVIKMFGNP